MTEYEQHAADKVVRLFKRDFARLVADAAAQMPSALEFELLQEIQKHTNVHECDYYSSIDIMRTNYGTKPKAALPDFLSIDALP